MKITFLWVGKTKEAYIREGIKKYLTFLKNYASVTVVEIKEEKGRLPVDVIKERQGQRILNKAHDYIVLDEHAQLFSSREFAGFIEKNSNLPLVFVIGGPFGLSSSVKEKARVSISLSPLTFTHEMARLILLEQLYRAFTIIKNKNYHY